MRTFRAAVQYDDWTGTAAADDIDLHLQDLSKFFESRGLPKNQFIVAFEVWNGENTDLGGMLQPIILTALSVTASKFDEAKEYLQIAQPIALRRDQLEMTPNEFFMLFKRFSFSLTRYGLLPTGATYEEVED